MTDYKNITTAIAICLCLFLFFYSIHIHRRGAKQHAKLEKLTKELLAAQAREQKGQGFQNRLQQAAVSTEIQKSRPGYNTKNKNIRTPERYRYAQSMAQSGMQTENISAALGMSSQEISQLQKLSAISSAQG